MSKLFSLLPYLVVLLALLGAAVVYLRVFAGGSADQYKRQPLLTANEHEFYHRLIAALPQLLVLPQVSMAAVIAPAATTSKQRLVAFRRISQKRIDFLVCQKDLAVVCAIELDDRTHDRRRDAMRDAMLASAGVATLRFESRAKPTLPEIAERVGALLTAAMPVPSQVRS